jgi:hypothetical protein
MPHAIPWPLHISPPTRNEVKMRVEDRLSRDFADVGSDVKAFDVRIAAGDLFLEFTEE